MISYYLKKTKEILASYVARLLTSVLQTSFRSASNLPLLSPQYLANHFWLDWKIRCFLHLGQNFLKINPFVFLHGL